MNEQVNDWIKNRLSPYFLSVLLIWIFYNRVLVFGVFNFESEMSLEQRILFVHAQLDSFPYLSFLNVKPIWRSIIWSIGWGFGAMAIYEILGTLGQALYEKVHQFRNWMLAKISKSKWAPQKVLDEANKQIKTLEEELRTKREETTRNQNLNEDARNRVNELSSQMDEKNKSIDTLTNRVQKIEEEAMKFKIVYATWGVKNKNIEVTRLVSDLLASRNKFSASNDLIGFDIHGFAIKKLEVEYKFNDELKRVTVSENEEVSLSDNKLIISETKESNRIANYENNLRKLNEIFTGEWELTFTKGSESEKEQLIIDPSGKYLANGQHRFDLLVPELDDKRITLVKIDLQTRGIHSQESLKIENEDSLSGGDDLGYKLQYKRSMKDFTFTSA